MSYLLRGYRVGRDNVIAASTHDGPENINAGEAPSTQRYGGADLTFTSATTDPYEKIQGSTSGTTQQGSTQENPV